MHLIYLLIITSVFGYIDCGPPANDTHVENEDDKEKIELFNKINLIITEIENINQNINNVNERFNIQTQDENKNLQLLKAEIRELKTDGMEMNQKLFQRMDHQDNLIEKSSKDVVTFNETINKIFTGGIEMKEQLFEKIDLQEKDVESFNKTINKFLTEGMEMKEQLFQKMDLQNNMIAKASKDVESFNETINKMLQINPIKQMPNWLTILKRQDGSVNFYRNWLDYKNGFGNPNGEYFIGLNKLHTITSFGGQHELLIVLKDFNNRSRYAKYDNFVVGSETEKYKIKKLGEFSGDAGDSFSGHLNRLFSTKDQDNDNYSGNCSSNFEGAWWFDKCYDSHLMGPYYHQPTSNTNRGIGWNSWHGGAYSLKFAEMMIRQKS